SNQISGYCYDSAGNLLDAGPCNTPHTYTYDAENNLSSFGITNYTYDGDGRRVSKWTNQTKCVRNLTATSASAPNAVGGGCPIGYHAVTVRQYLPIYVYGGNSVPLSEVDPAHSQGTLLIPSTSVNYTFFAGRRIAKLGALGSEISGFAPNF